MEVEVELDVDVDDVEAELEVELDVEVEVEVDSSLPPQPLKTADVSTDKTISIMLRTFGSTFQPIA